MEEQDKKAKIKEIREMRAKYSLMLKRGGIILFASLIVYAVIYGVGGRTGLLESRAAGTILNLLGIGGAGVGTVMMIIGATKHNKIDDISRNYCESCGESMVGASYGFRETGRQRAGNSDNVNVWVEIKAKCPHCGITKTYQRAFTVNSHSNNIQYQVEKYCENIYKH